MYYKKTITNPVTFEGIGLHTGRVISVTLRPSFENGIYFLRTDIPGHHPIKASHRIIGTTSYATTLGENGEGVATVEHLLSALFGLGITNLIIELDGPEIPIMDGSALPFVALLKSTGIVMLDEPKQHIKMNRTIEVNEGDKSVRIMPAETLRITFVIEFDHPLIRVQTYTFDFNETDYIRSIAPARTFATAREVGYLKSVGLAQGGSLENAIVLDDETILNGEDALRFHDEFVRHKILDLIGDLSLFEYPVIGHIIAHKSGHALNAKLVREIFANKHNYSIIGEVKRGDNPVAEGRVVAL